MFLNQWFAEQSKGFRDKSCEIRKNFEITRKISNSLEIARERLPGVWLHLRDFYAIPTASLFCFHFHFHRLVLLGIWQLNFGFLRAQRFWTGWEILISCYRPGCSCDICPLNRYYLQRIQKSESRPRPLSNTFPPYNIYKISRKADSVSVNYSRFLLRLSFIYTDR
jgi:hypothetical protein